MKNKKENIVYLYHIRDAIEKILGYLKNHNYEELEENEWDQDAIARNLEIIGEAANNLSPEFCKNFNEVPWRKIIDLRNVVAHDYADLDLKVIWNIITQDAPGLSGKISKIIAELE
jgi:uncharacterized protein with HEPN domain